MNSDCGFSSPSLSPSFSLAMNPNELMGQYITQQPVWPEQSNRTSCQSSQLCNVFSAYRFGCDRLGSRLKLTPPSFRLSLINQLSLKLPSILSPPSRPSQQSVLRRRKSRRYYCLSDNGNKSWSTACRSTSASRRRAGGTNSSSLRNLVRHIFTWSSTRKLTPFTHLQVFPSAFRPFPPFQRVSSRPRFHFNRNPLSLFLLLPSAFFLPSPSTHHRTLPLNLPHPPRAGRPPSLLPPLHPPLSRAMKPEGNAGKRQTEPVGSLSSSFFPPDFSFLTLFPCPSFHIFPPNHVPNELHPKVPKPTVSVEPRSLLTCSRNSQIRVRL